MTALPEALESVSAVERRLSRARGCLLGLACGDALGMPLEGSPPPQAPVRDFLPHPLGYFRAGEWTDDTSQALAIARSIVELGRFDAEDIMARFVEWYREGGLGIGRTTYFALDAASKGRKWREASLAAHERMRGLSAGNATIMRCAPVGICRFAKEERLIEESLTVSKLTHWDDLGGEAAVAVNMLIARFVAEESDRDAALGEVALAMDARERRVAGRLREAASSTRSDVRADSAFVLDTLQAAVWAFLETKTLESCVVLAANLGGDADTIAAVAGALSGAFYGEEKLPVRWRRNVLAGDELASLADGLINLGAEAGP